MSAKNLPNIFINFYKHHQDNEEELCDYVVTPEKITSYQDISIDDNIYNIVAHKYLMVQPYEQLMIASPRENEDDLSIFFIFMYFNQDHIEIATWDPDTPKQSPDWSNHSWIDEISKEWIKLSKKAITHNYIKEEFPIKEA